MLKVDQLNVFYGDVQVLFGVSLLLEKDEIVAIIGSNGAGKSTLLKTISGLLRAESGTIEFFGELLNSLSPVKIVQKGISQVMEGRGIFPSLSVYENLLLGSYSIKDKKNERPNLFEEIFQVMPILRERQSQSAGSLSGGEQQLLAIGRGLMSKPKLLMLDEPTLGLAPKLIPDVFKLIRGLRQRGTGILLVEQNVKESLQIASRGYVLREGRIVLSDHAQSLLGSSEMRKAYLGA